MTYEPDIFEEIISGEDWALIIATDGLWAWVSNEEVGDILTTIYKQRRHYPNMFYGFDWISPKEMASRLTHLA